MVFVLEDLEAVTEPVQLGASNLDLYIDGRVRRRTHIVTIRVLTSWVVPIDEDNLNK